MSAPRARPVLVLGLGILIGIAATLVQWRLACRVPISEGCVWGRALLPLSLPLGAAAGAVVAGVAYLVLRLVQQGRQGPEGRR